MDWRISFHSLASSFVTSAIFRPLLPGFPFPWRQPDDTFQFFEEVYDAIPKLEEDPRVFGDPDWVLSRFEHMYRRAPDEDRAQVLKLIALHQARVDLTNDAPVRFYPFSRDPAPDAPRTVVIDPEVRFGRPTVKGAPTDVLVERWRAGDNSADFADDYGLTTDEVDEALRYEAAPYPTPFRHRSLPLAFSAPAGSGLSTGMGVVR
jgi:uncharacterized protein (DUF433 family)